MNDLTHRFFPSRAINDPDIRIDPEAREKCGRKAEDDASAGLITEDAAALLFADAYGGQLRFCRSHGAWFEWTGNVWTRNETDIAFHHARVLARNMARGRENPKARIGAGKAAFAAAVERFCRADPVFAVTAETWDRDDFLLGTPGGTVDLRTGKLRAASPADGITKSTTISPSAMADCPRWLRFLDEATGGDAGAIRFLQQWCGYSLTGDTREHALVFTFGPGGNGKSVFLNVLAGIAGDYATTASMDTFAASHGDRHPTDLAMLRGARIVTASETEEGRQWAEARVKQMTGGDRIAARFMRQDFFEFTPRFKLLIVGNHKPGLKNVDDAARRRFNLVPFTRKPAVPDRQLEEKLKAEWPGILRWMIEGCLDWQAHGLVKPEAVKEATDDYFAGQDVFADWLSERCIVEKDNDSRKETTADLFASWSMFAKAANEDAKTQKALVEMLERVELRPDKNVPTIDGRRVRGFRGISLRQIHQRE